MTKSTEKSVKIELVSIPHRAWRTQLLTRIDPNSKIDFRIEPKAGSDRRQMFEMTPACFARRLELTHHCMLDCITFRTTGNTDLTQSQTPIRFRFAIAVRSLGGMLLMRHIWKPRSDTSACHHHSTNHQSDEQPLDTIRYTSNSASDTNGYIPTNTPQIFIKKPLTTKNRNSICVMVRSFEFPIE
jgi:hypothetical protein